MIINALHFEGSMSDLGVAFADEYDGLLHRKLRGLQYHNANTGAFFKPFTESVEEATEISEASLGGIREQQSFTPTGEVECIGGKMLCARYRFKPTDIVSVFYGELEGVPFFFMSVGLQLPGTLLGMGRSGIAWARRVPQKYNFETGDVARLYNMGANDWGRITSMLFQTSGVSLSAPYPHGVIKNLPAYRHKVASPEHDARTKFENAEDDNDLLVLLDSTRREVTLIRGGGSEMTYDILAQY